MLKRSLGVVLLSQYFHPEVGATQTRLREMARAWQRAGHRVTVICEFPNHPHGVIPPEYRGKLYDEDELDGYRVLRTWVAANPVKTYGSRMSFYLSYAALASLAACRRLGRVDLVVASSPPLPVGLAGWAFSRLRRAPFVLDVRDLWPDAAVALGELTSPRVIRAAERAERFLYRSARFITTVTEGYRDDIAGKGIPREKILLAPNGTIPELFSPERADPDLKARLGLEGRFVVTFAGLLGLSQGLDFLLDLAASYREDPGVAFLIIGDGPRKAELERRIAEEGLGNVRLHPQVAVDEIAPFLNASDLLLVTLRNVPGAFYGMLPIKLYDYLACRPPVLVAVPGSDGRPGQAEALLHESGGGLAARPEDLASFRAAIDRLRADPEAARRMGEAGQQFVLPRFARHSIMDELVAELAERLGLSAS